VHNVTFFRPDLTIVPVGGRAGLFIPIAPLEVDGHREAIQRRQINPHGTAPAGGQPTAERLRSLDTYQVEENEGNQQNHRRSHQRLSNQAGDALNQQSSRQEGQTHGQNQQVQASDVQGNVSQGGDSPQAQANAEPSIVKILTVPLSAHRKPPEEDDTE